MRGLFGDLHFAWRAVVRHPAFVVLGLFILALGIGANTAIFAVLDTAVLRPLPYHQADRLVSLRADRPFTLEELQALQEESKTLASISGYRTADLSLTGAGEPEIVHVGMVSASHWNVLGTVPALGRSPSAREELAGSERTVVLNHGLWERRFGGDPGVLGRRITLEGPDGPFRTVIGVMPAGYRPLDPDWQAWIPPAIDPSANAYRGNANLQVIARLAPGSDLTAAASEVADIVRRVDEADPGGNVDNVRVTTLHDRVVKDSDRMLALLLAAMSLVLLIACANVANLLLAWAETRQHEAAVRSALGAGRGRLVRQVLTESVMLGVLGGVGGLLLARAVLAWLVPRLPSSVPQIAKIGLDGRVLVFSLGSAILCGVVFGALPAWKLSRELPVGMASAGATSTPRWRSPMSLLVALEIGLCLALVAAAGLMLKSLWLLESQNPGFAVNGVITLRPRPSESRYGPEQRYAFTNRVLERLEAVPAVDLEGAIFPLPMATAQMAMTYTTEGGEQSGSESPSYADLGIVSPGVFSALGVRLLEGRDFTAADRAGGEPVAIVSRSLARKAWSAGSALGRPITAGGQQVTVVGVVADVRQQDLGTEPIPTIYRPYAQTQWAPAPYLVVRTKEDADRLIPVLRNAVWQVDAKVPITSIATMSHRLAVAEASPRFLTLLLVLSGALALVLAAVGVYGVMSLAVRRSRRELGIRMALGATRSQILWHAVLQGSRPIVAGLVLGLCGAWALGHWLASLLFHVQASDPEILAIGICVLGAAAFAALWAPARAAAHRSPSTTLREV